MPSPFDNDKSRDAFREVPRHAVMLTNRIAGTPIGVPVWDLEDPERKAVLESWQQVPEELLQLTLTPTQIRTGQ